LNISADFSLAVPLLNLAKLATVKGPLRGQGTRVEFHIGLAQGWARFYEHDGYLYVEMSVTELFGRTLPGKPQTVRLIRLPVATPKLQFQYVARPSPAVAIVLLSYYIFTRAE
jgi:hypothetical protein